jgi:hypothetical protein
VQRLRVLREAGLSPKAVFLILQTYGLSSLNHLQRANYESGRWVDDFDQVLFEGLEDLLGDALGDGQRALAGLRFADGGLAFGGARARSSSAFLASWALCLRQVAQLLGASSMDGLSASCPNVCTAWRAAEADLRARGGSGGRALLWHSFLEEATPKLQGVWSQQVRECAKDQLLTTLSDEAAADVQSNGGTGAGGFAQLGSDSECVPCMPQAHFVVTLRDRLLLPLSPEGARCQHCRSDTGLLCALSWTGVGSTRACVPLEGVGCGGMIPFGIGLLARTRLAAGCRLPRSSAFQSGICCIEMQLLALSGLKRRSLM